jgi:hypothetical protein
LPILSPAPKCVPRPEGIQNFGPKNETPRILLLTNKQTNIFSTIRTGSVVRHLLGNQNFGGQILVLAVFLACPEFRDKSRMGNGTFPETAVREQVNQTKSRAVKVINKEIKILTLGLQLKKLD